jgi:RND family efflux transporter MFP subunit
MKPSQLIRILSSGPPVLVVALLASACNRGGVENHPQPPAVTVAPVQQEQIVEWDEFSGRVAPVETVEVRPRVSGHIQSVKFQSGQLVKRGDVLFEIDPRWHQAEFDRRQAEYEQAKVRLENAEREAKRTVDLLATRAISQEEGEAREARAEEARAALLAAAAARDTAKLDLDYTQIRAPIDGRVSRELQTVGNFVSGTAGAATVLTTIVSVDPVYVYADIDENSLLRFNRLSLAQQLAGDASGAVPVEMALADEEGFPHRGTIESFDNKVDSSTGSILLRAVFSNPDGRIVPGLFARIRIPLSERYVATLVEERAIGTDQGNKYVLALTSTNTVEYRAIELGPAVRDLRIVRSGLNPGETIVVNGLQRVRPGMPVTPETAVARVDSENRLARR